MKHPDDGQLIAYEEKQLSARATRRIDQHLLDCWICRARLAEFAGTMAALARLHADSSFLGPDQVEEARKLGRRNRAGIEAAQPESSAWRIRWWRVAAAAACLPLAWAGIAVWQTQWRNAAPKVAVTERPRIATVPVPLPATPPHAAAMPEPVSAPAPRVPYIDAEVEALALLDRANLLGGAITVDRDPSGGAALRGIVASDDERRALRTALAESPYYAALHLEVNTADEALAALAATPAEESIGPVVRSQPPLWKVLVEGLGRDGQSGKEFTERVTRLSNQILSESEALLAEASVLRRLRHLAAPPEAAAPSLSPRSAELLAGMLDRRRQAASRHAARLRDLLGPVWHLASPEEAAGPPAEGRELLDRIIDASLETDRLVHELIAGDALSEPVEQSITRLRGALAGLQRHLSEWGIKGQVATASPKGR